MGVRYLGRVSQKKKWNNSPLWLSYLDQNFCWMDSLWSDVSWSTAFLFELQEEEKLIFQKILPYVVCNRNLWRPVSSLVVAKCHSSIIMSGNFFEVSAINMITLLNSLWTIDNLDKLGQTLLGHWGERLNWIQTLRIEYLVAQPTCHLINNQLVIRFWFEIICFNELNPGIAHFLYTYTITHLTVCCRKFPVYVGFDQLG